MDKHDFRVIMLHEFKLGHCATEATRNINSAWGMETAAERTVRRWFQKFASGDQDLQDAPGRGRKASLDKEELKAAVEAHPEMNTRALAAKLGVAHTTIRRHLAEIGKVKKIQKCVPKSVKRINIKMW